MPESCKSPFPLSCASSWLSLGFLPPPCSKQPSFAFCSCCSTPTPFSRGMTHPVSGGACRVLGKAQTRLCPLWALRSWQSSRGKGVMLSRLHEWRRRRTPRHQRAAVQCLGHRRAQGPGWVTGPPRANGPADTAPLSPSRQLLLQPWLLCPTPPLLPHTGPSHSRHCPLPSLGSQIRCPCPALCGLGWSRWGQSQRLAMLWPMATAPPAAAQSTLPGLGQSWTGKSRDHREPVGS